jgi:hypothetical protein
MHASKFAVTLVAALTVSVVELELPLALPLQFLKLQFTEGFAVRVTDVPGLYRFSPLVPPSQLGAGS